jgi:transposase InsO family protein
MRAMPNLIAVKAAAALCKVSERYIRKIAENIPRTRRGVGGANNYPIVELKAALPKHLRARLDAALAPPPMLPVPTATRENERRARAIATLGRRGEARMAARLFILKAADEFVENSKLNATEAEEDFVALIKSGSFDIPMEIRLALRGKFSTRTLRTWRELRDRHGAARLAGEYRGGRESKVSGDLELQNMLIGLVAKFGRRLGVRRALELSAMGLGRPVEAMPHVGSIGRWLRRYRREHATELLAYERPADFRGLGRVKFGRAGQGITRPNACWQLDGTPADCEVDLEDNLNWRRCQVINLVDVAPRRAMSLLAPSESAFATARLLRSAILEWGIPDKIVSDNGAGFLSHHVQALLADLHIVYQANPPRTPELKPNVESFNKTQSHELFEILPEFKGHSVAGAQQLPARQRAMRFGSRPGLTWHFRLTAAELQERINQWLIIYNSRPHSALSGRSPNEFIAQWPGAISWIEDERSLDLLLGERCARTIGRDGIHLDGAVFVAPELAAHVGKRVLIIRDGDDMGRIVVYLELQRGREFLCVAKNVDRLGTSRREVAVLGKQLQSQVMTAFRSHMRRAKRAVQPERIVDAYLENGAAAALPTPRPQLALTHTTPALEAAAIAADAIADEINERRKVKPGTADGHERDSANPDDSALDEFYLAIRAGRELPAWAPTFLARCGDGKGMAPAEWAAHWETLPEFGWFRKRETRAVAAREADRASTERLQRIARAARDQNEMRRRAGAY